MKRFFVVHFGVPAGDGMIKTFRSLKAARRYVSHTNGTCQYLACRLMPAESNRYWSNPH